MAFDAIVQMKEEMKVFRQCVDACYRRMDEWKTQIEQHEKKINYLERKVSELEVEEEDA